MRLDIPNHELVELDEIAIKEGTTARGIIHSLIREYLERVRYQAERKVIRHAPVKPDDCETLPSVIGVC